MSEYSIRPEQVRSSAEGAARIRALAALEPDVKIRNPDHLAREFLDPEQRPPSGPPELLSQRRGQLEGMMPGLYHFHNARTMHIDSLLREAIDGGFKQIVVLGAGYDSRAYRFGDSAPGVRFFEVDLPELQQEKKRRVVDVLGALPSHVTYLPLDFNSQRLEEILEAADYDASEPSFFNWEGVSFFLTAGGVDTTLASVVGISPAGSAIVFDYVPRSMIDGTRDYYGAQQTRAFLARLGEPYTFGIEDGTIGQFLSQRGFWVESDIGPKELEENYLIRSDGQLHGRVLGFMRIVHAVIEGQD